MKIILAFLLTMVFSAISLAQTSQINIVPKPNAIQYGTGIFRLNDKTRIVASDTQSQRTAEQLNYFLKETFGFRLKITSQRASKNYVEIMPASLALEHLDGYRRSWYNLRVESDSIKLEGTAEGQFYALQTLFQLLPINQKGPAEIGAVLIVDKPRFPYRGMHLDVGRHFMPVEFVKKYIDLMAQYKFNYFHWHLTEDQGWRIEIKKYPRLTEIGSKRPETVVGHNLQPYVGDKTPHEGFYTQDQIRDIVAYAKARYITVIPEIEMPGHSSAALAAYPEFGCKQDYQYKVQTTWGIFKEVYCPTEKTFQFLQDVIDEVIALFPDSPYIHIGGDEVLKDMWKDSPDVQELMQREKLKDLNEVQSYFVQRMEKYINSRGKKIIGWDEILEGGLAPNATVMSWRGTKGGIEAAKAHHDVIMTPTEYTYLNFGQGDPTYEPLSYSEFIPLERVYRFDPVPKELSPDEAKYIIGGQGNLWSEYIQSPGAAEYQLFPRMLALAEDLWTEPQNKNYTDFLRRLTAQYPRLDKENVNYRIPEPVGLQNMVLGSNLSTTVELKPAVDGAKIYYTTDGTVPDEKSALYDKPIQLSLKQNERVDLKTIEVLPNGRKSSVYAATILGRDYLEPTELKDKRQGVTFAFTMPAVTATAEPLLVSGETRATGFQQFAKLGDLKQPFTVSFDGFINVPSDGIYEFQTESIWDAAVTVDGEKIIDSTGTKDRSVSSAVLPLKAGYHRIDLRYNHRGGNSLFRVRYGLKGQVPRAIGGAELAH